MLVVATRCNIAAHTAAHVTQAAWCVRVLGVRCDGTSWSCDQRRSVSSDTNVRKQHTTRSARQATDAVQHTTNVDNTTMLQLALCTRHACLLQHPRQVERPWVRAVVNIMTLRPQKLDIHTKNGNTQQANAGYRIHPITIISNHVRQENIYMVVDAAQSTVNSAP